MLLGHKVAIVTGGRTGIGKAIGTKLARNGARVAIASRNPAHLEATNADLDKLGLPVLRLPMDLRKKEDIQRTVAAEVAANWGANHIPVNSAGISGLSRLDDPDGAMWYDILDPNLSGVGLLPRVGPCPRHHRPGDQHLRWVNDAIARQMAP